VLERKVTTLFLRLDNKDGSESQTAREQINDFDEKYEKLVGDLN